MKSIGGMKGMQGMESTESMEGMDKTDSTKGDGTSIVRAGHAAWRSDLPLH